MDAALRHALDRDSPYFKVLLQIFSRLPSEDIARCRALSRSAHRLLYDGRFLSSLPLNFSGFIFIPSPTGQYLNYFSIPSSRNFTNITWYMNDHWILSSHDNLLLTTGPAVGMPWNITNPLTHTAITTPRGFFRNAHVISAAICCQRGSDNRLFFLVRSRRHGQVTWMVTLSKTTIASGLEIRQRRSRLSGNLLLSSVRNIPMGEIRPAVHAIFASRCFVCVLFPESKQVLVVCCRSHVYWVLQVSRGDALGGEYGLCRNAAREVHLTWVSGEYVVLSRLQLNRVNSSSVDLEPRFQILRALHIVQLSHFPGLRIQHFESEYVYLRYGPFGKYIQPYNIQTSSMEEDVIELPFSRGEEGACGCYEEAKWPPVFAYSGYLGVVVDRWQD